MESSKVLEHIEKVQKEREITVDDIKKEFDKAVSIDNMNSNNYCVGGAVFLYFGDNSRRFPDPEMLAAKLQELNPRLTRELSLTFACRIIKNNDTTVYENAWTQLRLALNYRKEK